MQDYCQNQIPRNTRAFYPTDIHGECGKCENCLKRWSRIWINRISDEFSTTGYTKFLTLTYADWNLPELVSQYKRDWQLFKWRLYKVFERKYGIKMRYFVCAELGGEKGRFHFHVLVFLPKDVYLLESDVPWKKGFIKIKTCKTQTAATYVGKYLNKYLLKEEHVEAFRRKYGQDFDPKIFKKQSPGLGFDRLLKKETFKEILETGGLNYPYIDQKTGKKKSYFVPLKSNKHYSDKIEREFPELYKKIERKINQEKYENDSFKVEGVEEDEEGLLSPDKTVRIKSNRLRKGTHYIKINFINRHEYESHWDHQVRCRKTDIEYSEVDPVQGSYLKYTKDVVIHKSVESNALNEMHQINDGRYKDLTIFDYLYDPQDSVEKTQKILYGLVNTYNAEMRKFKSEYIRQLAEQKRQEENIRTEKVLPEVLQAVISNKKVDQKLDGSIWIDGIEIFNPLGMKRLDVHSQDISVFVGN